MKSPNRKFAAAIAAVCLVIALGGLAGCDSQASVLQRLDKAASELSAGKYRAAEIELKNVLQKQPDNGDAWLLLGRVSLASGQNADAAVQLRRARSRGAEAEDLDLLIGRALIDSEKYDEALSELSPDKANEPGKRARILALRGIAYMGKQEVPKASQAFDSALALDPGLAKALVGKAGVAQANNHIDTARELYQQAVSKNPSDVYALQAQALFVYNQNECRPAIDLFQTLLGEHRKKLTPGQAFLARAYMADCMLRVQRFEDADQQIARLMKQAPENLYANYLQTLVDVRHKDYEQATVHLQRLLRSSPGSTRGLLLLAAVKIAQNDPEPAELYLNEVLEQDPDNVRAIGMLASVYLKQDRAERAIKLLQDARARNVDDPKIRAMLADAMVRAAKGRSPVGYRNDIARPGSMDADLKLDLARAVAQSGKSQAALSLLDEVAGQDAGERFKATVLKIGLLLRQNQADKAVAEARRLKKESPKDVRAARLLASTYLAAGKSDAARTLLRETLKENPDDADVRLELALLDLRAGDDDDAEQQFRNVLSRAPDDSRAMTGLARLAGRRGETQAAIQWLQKAHAAAPEQTGVSVALVQGYLAAHQPDKAVPVMDKLVEQNRENAALQRLQGITQLAVGNVDQALGNLEAAADLAKNRPAYRLDLARALLVAGRNDDALKQLNTLRKSHPDFLPAVPALIVAQLRLGKPDAALATADAIADRPQGKLAAKTLRGDIYRAQGEYEKAVAAYAEVYKSAPSAAVARSLFEARRRAGEKKPQRSLEDWLKREPDDAGIALTLAQWYQSDNRLDAAVQKYRLVLDDDPDNVAALNNLALVYAQQHDSKAVATARRAYRAAPDNPAVLDTLGWIRVQSDNLKEGLPLLRRAAKASNAQPEIAYHLAFALAHTGQQTDRDEAQDILKRLLDAKGGFESRGQARALLNKLNGSGKPS